MKASFMLNEEEAAELIGVTPLEAFRNLVATQRLPEPGEDGLYNAAELTAAVRIIPDLMQATIDALREITASAAGLTLSDMTRLERELDAGQRAEPALTKSRNMAEIKVKRVNWLWPHRIPRGKIVGLAGHPDQGKTQLALHMASVVSTGSGWPDCTTCPRGKVIILSGEDDAADTIAPRLIAAGADLRNIEMLDMVREPQADGSVEEHFFDLTADLHALAQLMDRMGNVALVMIDVIDCYMGGTDTHRNAAVRGMLMPLKELAEKYDATILGLTHLTKASADNAVLRMTGSVGIGAAMRAAWLVSPEMGEDGRPTGRKLFLRAKGNLGKPMDGFAYRIEGVTLDRRHDSAETSKIVWDGPVVITADAALAESTTVSGVAGRGRPRSGAEEFLQSVLSKEPVPVAVIKEQAKAAGIAWKTVERAKRDVGALAKKGADGWVWMLPVDGVREAKGLFDE